MDSRTIERGRGEVYTITSPPLVVQDKLIVRVASSECGVRGFLDAYDAATGMRLWRFNTMHLMNDDGRHDEIHRRADADERTVSASVL